MFFHIRKINKIARLTAILFCIACFTNFSCNEKRSPFELITSEKTHITFNNKLVDSKESNILIYSNFYGGAGVGVGDFNKDGLSDLYFAGNLVGDELYLNKGDFAFENITKKAGIKDNGGWSSGVVVGDINNDGWPDIYVTRELYDDKPSLRKNKLYINNGDLTFSDKSEEYQVDHDGRTRHAVLLDFDKDGWLDLFLLTQPPNPGNYSQMLGTDLALYEYAPVLLRNTAKGYFENVSKGSGLDVPGFPNSVSAADFNNDGWTDLYLSNDFKSPDKLYINQKDGTFQNVIDQSMGHITYFSMGVDAADINNDGLLDISVLDMAAEDNFRIKSNMSGMNPKTFWDIYDQGGHYQYMYNSLQVNNGVIGNDETPSFSDIAQLSGVSSTDWSWSNLLADFDNDGFKDMYVTNGLLRDIRNTDGDKKVGDFINKVIYNYILQNPNVGDVSIWDILNLDEALDILPSVPLSNYMYKNQSGLKFSNVTSDWGLNQDSFSNGAAYVDLNNDGALDIVVNNINEEAFIYRNNSKNNYFRVLLKNDAPILGCKVRIQTGNEEQWYEFTSVRGMYSCSEQVAHFGVGSASNIERLTVFWNDSEISEYTDLEVNQVMTIAKEDSRPKDSDKAPSQLRFNAVSEENSGLVFKHQENDFDDYQKQVLLPHKMSQMGPALAVGDINGDGREDLFVGGALGQASSLFVQDDSGKFAEAPGDLWNLDARYEDVDALFFDFDNDEDLDLYVVSGGNAHQNLDINYQDRLYRNDGNGGFEKHSLPEFFESGSCVRHADFDSDGDLDLFIGGRHTPWSYPEPTSSRLLLNEGGKFTDVTNELAKELIDLGMVTDAEWTDFDADGLIDLLIVGEWMPITYMRNNGKAFYNATAEFGFENTTGWWYGLASEDLDQDGDKDYVLGNLGLNYKYKASAAEPFEVYYRDFDKNGQRDIVLSYYNFGEQYPLRGRSCSSEQVPEIKEKFETYDLFASANLYDVYGDELSEALNYKAQLFEHSKITNLGQGKFEISSLPEYTQISSINDFVLFDFDQDAQPDVLAVGNNFPVEIETPRNDAGKGVFLANKGGKLDALPPSKSGFFVPGDAKKLATIKIKDVLHIVVGNNDDSLELFEVSSEK